MLIRKVTDLLSFIVWVYSIVKISISLCVVLDSLPDPECPWESLDYSESFVSKLFVNL